MSHLRGGSTAAIQHEIENAGSEMISITARNSSGNAPDDVVSECADHCEGGMAPMP